MNEFEIAKLTLEKIVVEEVPFALAIRNSFKKYNVEPQARNNITALLGCELRHHYLLDNLINRYFDDIEFEKTIYLRFLISNKLFLKRFNNDELLKLVDAELDKDIVNQLVDFVSSTKEIIPNELDKTSPEYLSMRFNTPAWVIKMWQKQFGKGVVFKVLKTNYRQSIPTIRVNEQLTTKEKVLANHPDLVASPIDNILVFQGKGTPKYFEEFKKNEVFFMKMGTKYILDKLEIEPIKRIAVFSDVPNNIYLDLVSRFGNNVAMDLIINHISGSIVHQHYISAKVQINQIIKVFHGDVLHRQGNVHAGIVDQQVQPAQALDSFVKKLLWRIRQGKIRGKRKSLRAALLQHGHRRLDGGFHIL